MSDFTYRLGQRLSALISQDSDFVDGFNSVLEPDVQEQIKKIKAARKERMKQELLDYLNSK